MGRVCRAMGMFVVCAAAAMSVYCQEAAKSQSTDPVTVNNKVTKQDYVFPTVPERFDRYVKSTIGPWRLARTGLTAGVDATRAAIA